MGKRGTYSENFSYSEEFCDLDFGDVRLNARFVKVIENFQERPSGLIQTSQVSWAEMMAAYRLLDNSRVSVDEILRTHREQTLARMSLYDRVLAIQDTTTLSYASLLATEGLGSSAMGNFGRGRGLFLHTTLATTIQGTPLGILGQTMWSRGILKPGDELYDTERLRWHKGISHAAHGNFTEVICVSDREADGADYFALSSREGVKFVVRAKEKLRKSAIHKGRLIASIVGEQPEAGVLRLVVRTQKRRKKGDKKQRPRYTRTAELTVRFCEVQVHSDTVLSPRATPSECKIRAVLVEEKNPPEDFKPACWLLFTNLPVSTFEEAKEVIEIYKVRWEIETFHKILKSACRVESAQLEHVDRLKRLITMLSIVGWRLHVLTKLQRENPNLPCTEVLSDDEWKTLYIAVKKSRDLPKKPPSLRQATLWIAQLGGYLGRKCDGEPGPLVLSRGWSRLIHYVEMHHTLKDVYKR
ncbi:MAG: IS4 family transposase [Bdellovibrionales bacterium]